MLNWPTSTTIKQLCGFLGLTGYYRHFVKTYASIAFSLTEFLIKDAFSWSEVAVTSFNNLKDAMTNNSSFGIA